MRNPGPNLSNFLSTGANSFLVRCAAVRPLRPRHPHTQIRSSHQRARKGGASSSQRADLTFHRSMASTKAAAGGPSSLEPPVQSNGLHRAQVSSMTAPSADSGPVIHDIYESKTGSWQYIVADPSTSIAVIIDPVLDFDPATSTITTESADSLLSLIKAESYRIDMILETHAHADHITAASYLQTVLTKQQRHRPLIGIGKRIGIVQEIFGSRYKIPPAHYEGVFDKLFGDDSTFRIGSLNAMAIHIPGHTPDHMGYKIGGKICPPRSANRSQLSLTHLPDNVFVGDSIFHADLGSARADFPGGSAETLFSSGRKLLSLPDHIKLWSGHDYPPADRKEPAPFMTVQQHREQNKHLKDGVSEQDFVLLRQKRDTTLAEPKLLHQSLQMNIRAGRLPEPTASGDRMLCVPLKLGGKAW